MKNKILALAAAIALVLTGCTEYVEIDRTVPPYFEPSNVHIHPEGWAVMPRRVLILPSWGKAANVTLKELDPIIAQEAGKLNAFEVIPIPPTQAMNYRSDQDFTLDEGRALAKKYAADGILLCRVTSSQPHRPIVLGVGLRLWNVPLDTTVWAVDEVLDSQMTLVANGAREYYLTKFRDSYPGRRSEKILESPDLFYQYVFYKLFSTFPSKSSQKKLQNDDMNPR
jgi:hypothetical protein